MTDADLEAKFIDLAEESLGKSGTRKLLDLCWSIGRLDEPAAIAAAARN